MIEIIRARVSTPEQLAQLAEEAIELAHAALKVRRALGISNPTPVSLSAALAKLEEELADVLLCLEVLGFEFRDRAKRRALIDDTIDFKMKRWVDRLEAVEKGGES